MVKARSSLSGNSAEIGWKRRIDEAADNFDWTTVTSLAIEYARQIQESANLPGAEVTSVLDSLRKSRRYSELIAVADSALGRQGDLSGVWRRYAQALVDRDQTAVALRLYTAIAADPETPEAERIEARGGVGRCYKQLFLTTTDRRRRADHLQHSLGAYLAAYHEDPQRFWHGINASALLARAGRDGIEVASHADPVVTSREVAARVLDTVGELRNPDAWALATACEACIVRGRFDDAVEYGKKFVEEPSADAFAIGSFLRQLLEIWALDTVTPPGHTLLPMLRAALLKEDGGQVLVQTRDVGAARLEHMGNLQLEKVLGYDRYKSLTWYRKGLLRCRAVARIETVNEDGLGTGFLVQGAALHENLPATVLVTNGHVLPETLDPGDAVVAFHGLDTDTAIPSRFRVVRTWWYEPSNSPHLDTTILELDKYPQDVEPIPVARRLPALTPNAPRAYVIGHPRGLEQPQFSLQDNLVLNYDATRLHYRSPTEQGSSGSPVFDSQWQLIGLHHAGAFDMPRLKELGGTYAANEAITVNAIRDRLATQPPGATDVE